MTQDKPTNGEGSDDNWIHLHLSVDEESHSILERRAENHHAGNMSATVREASRFLDTWKEDDRSLLPRLYQQQKSLEAKCKGIESDIETLSDQFDRLVETILLENNSTADGERQISQLKLEQGVRMSLSQTTPKSIEEIAAEQGSDSRLVREAVEKLANRGKAKRVTDDSEVAKYVRH